MTLNDVTRAGLDAALAAFDESYRSAQEWQGWQKNKNYKFAIASKGRLYPVKFILSLASDVPVGKFSGGEAYGNANSVVRRLGFEVVGLRERNPAWNRDELILCLDLYMRFRPKALSESHPRVIALSERLHKLALLMATKGNAQFRNPNGVSMKMGNFHRLDPMYIAGGKLGLPRGSKLDAVVWEEFVNDAARLHDAADAITAWIESGGTEALSGYMESADGEEAEEGRILAAVHRKRERSAAIVAKKKTKAKTLACEVCGFDFGRRYGERGNGYIECHHTVPVSQLRPGQKTKLGELSLVCSNCHRVIHRCKPWLSIEELRALLAPS